MFPLAVSAIALAIILGGTLVGALLRKALPEHHLAEDAKDIIRLGSGLIGTIAALVLGLLIASAKTSYDIKISEVQHLTADLVLLDKILEQYGPEARPARDLIRRAVRPFAEKLWRESGPDANKGTPFVANSLAEDAFTEIVALAPTTDPQRALKARAIEVSTDLAQTRLTLFVQPANAIPMPFLAVLVFWLGIIFASFSLFARLNATVIVALFVFALSASAALFLILEMSQPFTGLMRISNAPLRNVLAPIDAQ